MNYSKPTFKKLLMTSRALALLAFAFVGSVASAEVQSNISMTMSPPEPGASSAFTAFDATSSGPGTFYNTYSGVGRYVLGNTGLTGRYSAFGNTQRYGVDLGSFHVFQSFLTSSSLTVVNSNTTCPGQGTYGFMNIRVRSPVAIRNAMDAASPSFRAGGVIDYDPGASPHITGTSSFDLAGPTLNASPGYTATGFSGATCSGGKYNIQMSGNRPWDPYGTLFFGTTGGMVVGMHGSPIVSILSPITDLTVGRMAQLSDRALSGLYQEFNSATVNSVPIYLFPDSNGTTFTLREITDYDDPNQYSIFGTLNCTNRNSPTMGFCSGTLTRNGVSGSGNVVCQVSKQGTADVLACTAQKPDNHSVAITLLARNHGRALIAVSLPNPAFTLPVVENATTTVTVRNMTGNPVVSMGIPTLPGDRLVAPFSLPDAFQGIGGTCGSILNAYASCNLTLAITPGTAGTYSQVLRIEYDNQIATVNATAHALGIVSLSSIEISPPGPFARGGTQQFTATARYSDNSTQDVTNAVIWLGSNPSVATVSSTGLATFVESGTFNVSATMGSVTGNSSITVLLPPPAKIVAYPNHGRIAVTWPLVSGATSYNLYWGTTFPVTSGNSTKVTGVTSPYTLTGLTNGTAYYFAATAQNALGESSLSVTDGTRASEFIPLPQHAIGNESFGGWPRGGIFVDGTTLYIANYGGLSISRDGGNTFYNRTVVNGLGSPEVFEVFAAGSNVYAATGGGLSISTDGGISFTNRTTAHGLPTNIVEGVWASGSAVYAATQSGLSISANGGTSFTNRTIANGLGSNVVKNVLVSGTTIFVATDGGLSISTDGGTSFSNRTTANGLGNNQVNNVFVSGSNVYAACPSGVSISTDGGSTFSNRGFAAGVVGGVQDVFVSGSYVYAATHLGLSVSADGGASFTHRTTADGLFSNGLGGVWASGSTVYAVNIVEGAGFSVSTDHGTTFTIRSTNGPVSEQSRDIFVSGSNLYLATGRGLFISTNGGADFVKRTTADGLGSNGTSAVFVSGSTVYVATESGLSISTNGGTSFVNRTTSQGLGSNDVDGVFASGSTVYAATFGGLSISTNGGDSFTNRTTLNGLGSNIVRAVSVSGSTVYAATNNGLSISTNGGSTFTNRTTANGLANNTTYDVVASGSNLWVPTFGGCSRSTDGGATFSNCSGASGANSFFVSGSTICAGTGSGLSISTDGGTNFIQRSRVNGIDSSSIQACAVDGPRVYAAGNWGLSVSDTGEFVSIAVTPPGPFPLGTSQQLTATAIYSSGVTSDITNLVTWVSSNPSAATVSATGFANFLQVGSFEISASLGAISRVSTMNAFYGIPSGVLAFPGNTKATIAWNPTAATTSYNLYWGTTFPLTEGNSTKVTGVTSPPHVLTGLSNGTGYYFAVSSQYGAVETSLSATTATRPSLFTRIPQNAVGFNSLGWNSLTSVFVDGSRIYAGSTQGGLSISTDGGNTFFNSTTASGLGNMGVRHIVVSGTTLYVATDGGLAISTDGGVTFVNRRIADGLGSDTVNAVAVSGSTVMAATSGGLSISTNGGTTFTNRTTVNGLGSNTVNSVAFSGATVLAATQYGLAISTNSGASFDVNRLWADGLPSAQINSVAISGSTVYAATTGGLAISTNDGTSFTSRTTANGLGNNLVNEVLISGATVYAGTSGGLSISTDGGSTFSNRTTSNGLGANATEGIFVSGSNVYAATSGGLSISTNGGASFTNRATQNNLASNTTTGIIASGLNIYVASNQGVAISTNGGATWVNRTTANGLGTLNINNVFVDGTNVYAATSFGLAISTNGGSTFVNRTTSHGLGSTLVNDVFASGNTVYAAVNGGLSISTDGGASFVNRTTTQGLGSNFVNGVYAVGSNVYVATSGGVSISTNGGTSFTNRTTANGLGSNTVRSVFASGTNIYAATQSGVSISTNSGTSFVNRTTANGLPSNDIRWVFADATNIYATTPLGLAHSTDSGTSFSTPLSFSSRRVFMSGSTVFVATDVGLFRRD
jgi:hypothetical protein